MTDSIPATKSKSKIRPLQERVAMLELEKSQLLEEMYDKGTRTRPTIMTQIEDKEAQVLSCIKFSIAECEKETGRKFISLSLANQVCGMHN